MAVVIYIVVGFFGVMFAAFSLTGLNPKLK
ncbi:MAG: hypothetical protein FD147_1472 [Chloroflexi bacterium]|nr:MAG: hypothetical protein FD147_1472 [Chloroflexota bacterium]